MSELDEQKLRIFTAKGMADKAISSLKGILLGINMDGIVNQSEKTELSLWAKSNHDLIAKEPFREFMQIIEESISKKVISKETIDDLFWLCQRFESENYYYNAVTSDLQILQGICHGILSDGVINEDEINQLHKWLSENEHLNRYYPYDEIRSLILSAISDRKIDDEENRILKAYFNQFIQFHNLDMKENVGEEIKDIHISGLCTSEPDVEYSGKTFCITGVLKRNSREILREKITKLGGIPTENVNRNTDYLIVGDNGNPAWAFSCYGRKVEKAVELRKTGHNIILIHEYDFCDIIDDLIN